MNLSKDQIREFVKQILDEMLEDEEILTQETNVSGDISGYDSPFMKTQKRKKHKKEKDTK